MTAQDRKSDLRIYEDVLQELRWELRITDTTNIGVAVDRGVVTLTGWVSSWAARTAACEAAHRVAGVRDVADEMHVKIEGMNQRTDADIARAARDALEWSSIVPHDRLHMTVARGVVTLEGAVESWAQHDEAGRAVGVLSGVSEIRNLITVDPPSVASSEVRGAIDEALERHATHAAKHVQIAVEGGVVTLTGRVPSWAERDAVIGAARGTKGVRRVDSQISIG